ncbi:MAG: hypothetical protein RLZ97_397 [Verrucomicrobiota bacterium]|jgi:hypothetical protein
MPADAGHPGGVRCDCGEVEGLAAGFFKAMIPELEGGHDKHDENG